MLLNQLDATCANQAGPPARRHADTTDGAATATPPGRAPERGGERPFLRSGHRAVRRPRLAPRRRRRATAGGTAGGARSSRCDLPDRRTGDHRSSPHEADAGYVPDRLAGRRRLGKPLGRSALVAGNRSSLRARSRRPACLVILASCPSERVCAVSSPQPHIFPRIAGFLPPAWASATSAPRAQKTPLCRQKPHKRP